MPNAADLPDDIAVLKVMLVARDAALAQSQNTVAELTQALSSRELQIEALQLQILALRRHQFGGKSEKLDGQIEQLELKLEELLTDEGQSMAPDRSRHAKEACSPSCPQTTAGSFTPRCARTDAGRDRMPGLRQCIGNAGRRCIGNAGVLIPASPTKTITSIRSYSDAYGKDRAPLLTGKRPAIPS
jgi:hypothetical protein